MNKESEYFFKQWTTAFWVRETYQTAVCHLISVKIIISYDFDNITSTKWHEDDEDIPTYTLEFFDGWQPPEVSAAPEPRRPVSRLESPRRAPSQVNLDIKHSPGQTDRQFGEKEEGEKNNNTLCFFCVDFSQVETTTTSPTKRTVRTSALSRIKCLKPQRF